jgi:hypothetical protein
MKNSRLIFIAFTAGMLLTLSSCRKQIENEIEGSWMKESGMLYSTVDEDSAIWTFQGGKLTINNITYPLYSEEGTYEVVSKNFKNYVRISDLNLYVGESDMNGDWQVIQYRKDKLTLSKPDRSQVVDSISPFEGFATGDNEIGNILREFTRMQ